MLNKQTKDALKYGLPWIIFIALGFLFKSLGWDEGGRSMDILFGIVAVYYFNIDNPHPAFKKATIISLLVWLLTLQLRQEFTAIENWLPALAVAALAFVYFQRFRAREDTHWVDYLKLVGVIALLPSTYLETGLTALVVGYLVFIYLLDRLIIRRQMNKSTQIITFCIMGLICLTFLIFAFIKANEAEKSSIEAVLAQQEAEKQRDEAVKLQQVAVEATAEARMQADIALHMKAELEECKQSK